MLFVTLYPIRGIGVFTTAINATDIEDALQLLQEYHGCVIDYFEREIKEFTLINFLSADFSNDPDPEEILKLTTDKLKNCSVVVIESLLDADELLIAEDGLSGDEVLCYMSDLSSEDYDLAPEYEKKESIKEIK